MGHPQQLLSKYLQLLLVLVAAAVAAVRVEVEALLTQELWVEAVVVLGLSPQRTYH
jgi:hypothetical protein